MGVALGDVSLSGDLRVPNGARGIVLFAHGAGSSRLSPRNQQVAAALSDAGFATLLFDLLTHDEDRCREVRFDIHLLTSRLIAATQWVESQVEPRGLPLGYFGASTGAAAALQAAAALAPSIAAVVSRGGRPDLAASALARVEAPTLLIVGGSDPRVLEISRLAALRLRCPHHIEVIPGASHLFEEPGALERVQHSATAWFERHMSHAELIP